MKSIRKYNSLSCMLHCIVLAMMLIPASALYAQNSSLTIDGPLEYLENDQTALGSQRKNDQNGRPMALFKVLAPQTSGFVFDAGAVGGFLNQESYGREIWVYVPSKCQELSISHEKFGSLIFELPALREGGVYQMKLNIGGGRYVNITTSGSEANGATISVDGEVIGNAPIYNYYMSFSTYKVKAERGRSLGETTFEVKPAKEGEKSQMQLVVQMIDQTPHYGNVNITVAGDPNAEIIYQGQSVGTGSWTTMLKEGTHEVITRKADCDEGVTVFTVKPQTDNNVTAHAPTPHKGNLILEILPKSATVISDGRDTLDHFQQQALTVGTHQIDVMRKDYKTITRHINILHNETSTYTIELPAENYLTDTLAFYFGLGYTASKLSGLTGYVGGVWNRFDLQFSYTLGMSKSNNVYMYNHDADTGHELGSGNNYKMNAVGFSLGYQIRLTPRLGITPQIGYLSQMLSASVIEGTGKYFDGAKASNLTIGTKILAVPTKHMYLFVAPQYAIPMSKDDTFQKVADAADFSAGGISVSAGVIFNFGK